MYCTMQLNSVLEVGRDSKSKQINQQNVYLGKGVQDQGIPSSSKSFEEQRLFYEHHCVSLLTLQPSLNFLNSSLLQEKKKIAQKKVIDTMCCSHALKFNEMNLLCFTHLTVTTFSYSKQVPQAVCCSLPFYITFPQWIFWSTVLPWEQITQSGYLSLYKLCKIRVDLASL